MQLMKHEIAVAQGKPEQVPDPRGRLELEDALWRATLAREAASVAGSQKRLALALGISKTQVARWLTADRPVPERWIQPMAELIDRAAQEDAA